MTQDTAHAIATYGTSYALISPGFSNVGRDCPLDRVVVRHPTSGRSWHMGDIWEGIELFLEGPVLATLRAGRVHCNLAPNEGCWAGVFLLKTFFYPEAEVVRTRDPLKLAECDIVLDVGGTYDPGEATCPLSSSLSPLLSSSLLSSLPPSSLLFLPPLLLSSILQTERSPASTR